MVASCNAYRGLFLIWWRPIAGYFHLKQEISAGLNLKSLKQLIFNSNIIQTQEAYICRSPNVVMYY
ncbi:MAG: hypothetical protein CML52_04475 [Rhodobacteraceae bacterium]|nr:hypothetical protein [Paracoccaceae bacterium]